MVKLFGFIYGLNRCEDIQLLQVYGGDDIVASITGFMVVRILRLLLQIYGGNDIAASFTGFTVVRLFWLLIQALWW